MSALTKIETRIKADSGNINHQGIDVSDSHNAYMDFASGKGSMEAAGQAIAGDIRTAIQTQALTVSEKVQLQGVLAGLTGSAKLAAKYVGQMVAGVDVAVSMVSAKVDGQGESGYNEKQGADIATSTPTRLKVTKLSSERINLVWLPDKYTAVEVNGTVKVAGKEVDVSRRVYQVEIDKNYRPTDPSALGMSNKELMEKGRAPYVIIDGQESRVELHHLIQREPGGMVEIAEIIHDKYSSILHGVVEYGNSFRNNLELEKQYNNFKRNYWILRANE